MASFLSQCCGARARKSTLWTMNEKTHDSVECYFDNPTLTREKTVTDVLAVLQGPAPTMLELKTVTDVLAVLQGPAPTMLELKTDVTYTIRANGWYDGKMAKMLFIALENLLRSSSELAAPMHDILDKVLIEAKKIGELAVHFQQEHPLAVGIVCAIVALGCCTSYGRPCWRSWDSVPKDRLLSMYGDVPYGSLFSYLQRLAMLAK